MSWRRFLVLLAGLSAASLWVQVHHNENKNAPQQRSVSSDTKVIESAEETEATIFAMFGVSA